MMKRTSTEHILEAMWTLHFNRQVITRESLHVVTGLTFSVIDDRIGYLVDTGSALRIRRGVFEPCYQFGPSRDIGTTEYRNKAVDLIIGADHLIRLSPDEAATVGKKMWPYFAVYQSVEVDYNVKFMRNELSVNMRETNKAVGVLEKELVETHNKNKQLEDELHEARKEYGALNSRCDELFDMISGEKA